MTRFRDHIPSLAVLLALTLVVGAGCGGKDDGPTQPSNQVDEAFADDIAQHFSNLLATDFGGMVLGLTAPAATIPAGAVALPGRGAAPASAARDTGFTVAGITWTIADTFYTAGGAAEQDYTTASVRMSVHATGTGALLMAGGGGIFGHQGHLAASGLSVTQDTLRFDGTGHDASLSWFTGRFSGVTRKIQCVADIQWEQVTVRKGLAPDALPLDGFAVCSVRALRYGSPDTTRTERDAQVTVLLAFDGSATLTMNVASLYEYTVNLRTGELNKLVARPS